MGVDSGDSSEVVSKYDIYTNYSEWSETKSSGASEEGGDNVVGGGLGGVIHQKWWAKIRFILITAN